MKPIVATPRRFSRPNRTADPWTLMAMLALAIAAMVPALAAQTGGGPLPDHQPDATIERDAIPDVYKWDRTPLFPSAEAWEAERAALAGELPSLDRFRGRLADPAQLETCLGLYFRLHDRTNHLTLYAQMGGSTDVTDDRAQAMQQSSLALMDDLMARATFIRGEVLALPDEAMAAAREARPGLETYRPYLDNLRRRRSRVLGPEAERVLSLFGDNLWAEIDLNELPSALEDSFQALLADIPWPKVHDESGAEVQLTLSNYGPLRASENRAVRREAVTAFFATLHRYRHAFAALLAGQYELNVALARARGYDTAIEAYLDKDALDPAVYDTLVRTVNANLEPLHRYVELRKKVMGLEDLHIYDLYVPMAPGVDVSIPYSEARATLLEALAPLGEGYVGVLEEALDLRNGWTDLYPSIEKVNGAFSASVYGRHPYILMNYQNALDDMSTLAHELGHAAHSDLAMKGQPYSSFRYVPFLAEIASTCNEALLSDHLVANAGTDAQRAYLLVDRLENIRQTIYRQTLFAEFEREVHRFVEAGTPVTATLLDETYADLVRRYYGPGFTLDEHDGMEWAYVRHFFYKYYVFNYATGLASGIAIADRVRAEGPDAAEAFLDMLRAGSSGPPLELLRSAGVDLTRPDAIVAALKLFERTLDELEPLLVD